MIFFENFYGTRYIFACLLQVSKTFAYLAGVVFSSRTTVICRYLFLVGFQYNFRQITARFSAGRRQELVVRDMLLFWCSCMVNYKFIKLDLVTAGKFCFHFSCVLGSVVLDRIKSKSRCLLFTINVFQLRMQSASGASL